MSKLDKFFWKTEQTLRALAILMVVAVCMFPSLNNIFL